jgi:hypothetical protein
MVVAHDEQLLEELHITKTYIYICAGTVLT